MFCICGCNKAASFENYFYSLDCKVDYIKTNRNRSKLIVYIELEDDDVIRAGDRAFYAEGSAFHTNSIWLGRTKKEFLRNSYENTVIDKTTQSIYRPLVIKSRLVGDERKLYRVR